MILIILVVVVVSLSNEILFVAEVLRNRLSKLLRIFHPVSKLVAPGRPATPFFSPFFFSMPSLFSRSRTTSTPGKKPAANALVATAQPAYDEFGRVNSGDSPFSTPAKKDAGKDKKRGGQDAKLRSRTLSSPRQDHDLSDLVAQIPDGSFLPLNLDRPRDESGEEKTLEHDYGYLSYERHVILGLDDVARLIDVVAVELGTRCLTTPFIFSTLALDISSSAIKRLIRAFLETCANPSSKEAEHRWREEARFAGPHELGMCFRWGLARVVRVVGGQAVRGLISWDHYVQFRDSEAGMHDSILPRPFHGHEASATN